MNEEFKLPSSSYSEIVKIIKAYSHNSDKASSLNELEQLSGIDHTIISSNNKFLLSVGIIEGGNNKKVTSRGIELSNALQYNQEGEISKIWKEVCKDSDFLFKMLTAIKIRNGMDETAFQNHIAYSSGQKNNSYTKTGSITVVEIFKIANLVKEDDGKLIYTGDDSDIIRERSTKTSEKVWDLNKDVKQDTQTKTVHEKNGRNVNINIEIKINPTSEELENLGPKLKKIIADLTDNDNQN